MSIPVIICDDSSFARKQVARALPKDWDVEITYAANGREGIEAISARKGDVLFLDLTMPEMDGFDVLEHIRSHDLPTLPIVISGDIQPDSYNKVMRLGAVAFIKKPVDAEDLCKTLDKYGVLDVLAGGDNEPSSTTQPTAGAEEGDIEFHDWMQEISNISMGRAADLLAHVIDETVLLSIPRVNILKPGELDVTLQNSIASKNVYAINQGFIGGGIAGETMIIIERDEIDKLAKLMKLPDDFGEMASYELLIDVSNILVGAFLKGFTEQLDINFSQGHPEIYTYEGGNKIHSDNSNKNNLAIELNYTLGEENVICDQLIIFTESSQQTFDQLIKYVLI